MNNFTKNIGSIVVLTGAGISAESGVPTFRASDGLWCGHKVEEVATPEGFLVDPAKVHAFYNERRRQLADVHPNPAHLALAELAARWEGELLLVTQNVDDLHERAYEAVAREGNSRLIHMHGELKKAQCLTTGEVCDWDGDTDIHCGYRPHIVWFGEMPLEMEVIYRALRDCDLFISIGTSGNVYPAAGFVAEARHHGAHTVELNLEPSLGATMFHEQRYGPASVVVPQYLREMVNGEW